MIRVLLVDDHDHFRDRIGRVLEADDVQVVAEAGDGREALAAAERAARAGTTIDLAIVDLGLPDMDGFALAGALLAHGAIGAVVLTSSRESVDPERLRTSGALAFVPKDQLDGAAIEQLLTGEERR